MTSRTQVAFNDFKFIHQGELYVFRTYQSLKAFRLVIKPCIFQPLFHLADIIEEKQERKLETLHKLPKGYLAGIFFQAKSYRGGKRLASRIAQDYHYLLMQRDIYSAIGRLLPDATRDIIKAEVYSIFEEQILDEPRYIQMEARQPQNLSYQESNPGHQGSSTSAPCLTEGRGMQHQPPVILNKMKDG